MTTSSAAPRLVLALDLPGLPEALAMAARVGPCADWCKVGSHLFCLEGPESVRALKRMGKKVFLDLKFHDIPNTVAGAVGAATRLGADMVNVHASGGREMMEAARAAAAKAAGQGPRPLLIAVTVLTSMDANGLAEVSGPGAEPPLARVVRLARLAKDAGMDGVVCSAGETRAVRDACGQDFVLVVPGIRPAGADLEDQKRAYTPAKAAADGAGFAVVGRPILKASDPAAAAAAIAAELEGRHTAG